MCNADLNADMMYCRFKDYYTDIHLYEAAKLNVL